MLPQTVNTDEGERESAGPSLTRRREAELESESHMQGN